MDLDNTELNEAFIALESALAVFDMLSNQIDELTEINKVLLAEGVNANLMLGLENIVPDILPEEYPCSSFTQEFSNINIDVALEANFNAINRIIQDDRYSLAKIIPLILAIIFAILKLFKSSNSFFSTNKVTQGDIEKTNRQYEALLSDPDIGKHAEGIDLEEVNRTINLIRKDHVSELDYLYSNKVQGYTVVDLLDTVKAIISITTNQHENIEYITERFIEINEKGINGTDLTAYLMDIRNHFLKNDAHLYRYDISTLLRQIELAGGTKPLENTERYIEEGTRDVELDVGPKESFWNEHIIFRGTTRKAEPITMRPLYSKASDITRPNFHLDIEGLEIESIVGIQSALDKIDRETIEMKKRGKDSGRALDSLAKDLKQDEGGVENSHYFTKLQSLKGRGYTPSKVVWPPHATTGLHATAVFHSVLYKNSLDKKFAARYGILSYMLRDVRSTIDLVTDINKSIVNLKELKDSKIRAFENLKKEQ